MKFFSKELQRLGAEIDEVIRFAKDKFGISELPLLTRAQAKQILTAWNPEPPADSK